MMEAKQAFQKKTEAQLEKLTAQINELKAKADKSQADAKVKYYEQIETLSAKQAAVQSQLQTLTSSSGQAWEEIKTGVENAVSDLQTAFSRAVSQFR
jgi:chromosome segregation ATPase